MRFSEPSVCVLIGVVEDPVFRHVVEAMGRVCPRKRWMVVDMRRLGTDVHCQPDGWEVPGRWFLPHQRVASVYNRALWYPPKMSRLQASSHDVLQHVCDHVYPWVINRPKATLSNASKPYQTALIAQHGWRVPEGVCVAHGVAPSGHGWLFKSISGERSIVQRLGRAQRKQRVSEPVLFQRIVPGQDVRVHVVGQDVVAHAMESNAIDYRYGHDVVRTPITLPPGLQQRCVTLARRLGLWLAGIDVRLSPEGPVVLEVNPSPGFSYFDTTGAILHELLKGLLAPLGLVSRVRLQPVEQVL